MVHGRPVQGSDAKRLPAGSPWLGGALPNRFLSWGVSPADSPTRGASSSREEKRVTRGSVPFFVWNQGRARERLEVKKLRRLG